MYLSNYLLPTLKENPNDAEIISHKLMIRAGFLRKSASGIYNYLPLCVRIINKIEKIIREEMNKGGGIELLMPILTSSELWIESGRWNVYGKELMRFTDRHNKEYALGPTHEEVITSLVKNEINSYRQLPICLYQINTKFRDEIRPRFGVMRAREFIMKDAYSFHSDTKSLSEYYEVMYKVYSEIFKRCGLKFRAVLADSGAIGGDDTHEFMVLAESGESRVLSCSSESCGYAATDETAESVISEHKFSETLSELELVETPDTRTIEEVAAFFRTDSRNIIKTIIYQGDNKFYAVLIRGDRDVNEIKLKKVLSVTELHIAHPEDVERLTGSETGYAGPVNMNSEISILADSSVEKMTNFIIGANKKGYHYKNANINRDFKINNYYDLRLADKGDKCVRCGSELDEYRGIEVGQIFKLGTKYSEKMNAVYTDENGNSLPFVMGCYGIGVTRIIASAIEQNNDDKGIIWPVSISPFEAVVVAFGKKGTDEYDAAEKIYKNLVDAGIDAAFDNRDLRPGVKFKDADLIGYPLQIIAGKKSLSENKVEISIRKSSEKIFADIDKITETVNSLLKEL